MNGSPVYHRSIDKDLTSVEIKVRSSGQYCVSTVSVLRVPHHSFPRVSTVAVDDEPCEPCPLELMRHWDYDDEIDQFITLN